MSHFANAEAWLHEIGEQEVDWIAGEGGAIIAVFVTVVIIIVVAFVVLVAVADGQGGLGGEAGPVSEMADQGQIILSERQDTPQLLPPEFQHAFREVVAISIGYLDPPNEAISLAAFAGIDVAKTLPETSTIRTDAGAILPVSKPVGGSCEP